MNNFSSCPIEVGAGGLRWFLVLVEAVDLDLVFADDWEWLLVLVVKALDLDLEGHILPSSQRLVQVEQ